MLLPNANVSCKYSFTKLKTEVMSYNPWYYYTNTYNNHEDITTWLAK